MKERNHVVSRAKTSVNANDASISALSSKGDTDGERRLGVVGKEDIYPVFWEPYIRTGYRLNGLPLADYLRYTCILHNDVFNFWSHFLVFLAWVSSIVYMIAVGTLPLEPYYYPMICYLAGACTYAFCSSFAHMISSKSFNFRTVCFMFDYHGISVYSFGFMMASFYYERPISHWLYASKWLHLVMYTVISVMATLFSCLSRFYWSRFRFVVRTAVFAVPVFVGTVPIVMRLSLCEDPRDCNPDNHFYLQAGYIVTFVSAFFFATKIPERLFPITFDIFGASHQVFHVTIAMATTIQMKFLLSDSSVRRGVLEEEGPMQPTFISSVLIYAAASLCSFLTFLVLTALRVYGYLVSEREKKLKKQEDGFAVKKAKTN